MVPTTIRALQRCQGRNPPRPERDMAQIAHFSVAKRSQGMTLASALRLELNDFGAYHAPNPECRYSLAHVPEKCVRFSDKNMLKSER